MKTRIWTAAFLLFAGALFGQVDSVTVIDPNDLASIGTDSVTDAFINIPVKGSGTTFYAVEPSQLQGRITLGTVAIATDSTSNSTFLGKFNQAQTTMLRYYTDHQGNRIEINDPLGVDSAYTQSNVSNDTLFFNRHDGSQDFVVIPPGTPGYVGQSNLMQNVGDGTGVYYQKVDSTFQLKSIKNTDGTLSINSTDTTIVLGASLSGINYWTLSGSDIYYNAGQVMVNEYGGTTIDTADVFTVIGDTAGIDRSMHVRNQYNDSDGLVHFVGASSTYGTYFDGAGIKFAGAASAGILATDVIKGNGAFLNIRNNGGAGRGIYSVAPKGNVMGVSLSDGSDYPDGYALTVIPRIGSAVAINGVKPLFQITAFGTTQLTTPNQISTDAGLAQDWRYRTRVFGAIDTVSARLIPVVVDTNNVDFQIWTLQGYTLTKTLTLESDGGATFHQINTGTASTNAAFDSNNQLIEAQESWGTTTDTTDGNGELAIAHGLSITPTWAQVTVWDATSATGYAANVVSIDATNVTIRVFDTSNADVASTSVKVSWQVKE